MSPNQVEEDGKLKNMVQFPLKALKRKAQSVGKILDFDPKKVVRKKSKNPPEVDRDAMLLMKISDELDAVILKHIHAGKVQPKDIVGLLAHRLGNLLNLVDQKKELWDVCERILKRQANLEAS